ncbi:MAG: hypothetical protein FWG88_09825 [Oscillospiraceae bacterium]|nr:hypothetical protein [Oscillospiraceae bacterium]
MKRATSILLAIILMFSLAACNGNGSNGGNDVVNDPNVGKWIAYSVDIMGVEYSPEEVFDAEATVELKADGTFVIVLADEVFDGNWSMSGNQITVDDGVDVSYGTIDGNLMELIIEEGFMSIFYRKEGTNPPRTGSLISPGNIIRDNNDDDDDDIDEIDDDPSSSGIILPSIPPVEDVVIDARNVGMWIGYMVQTAGREIDMVDVYRNGAWIELRANGECTLSFDGTADTYKWKQTGRNVTFTAGNLEYYAIIMGDVLEFELADDIIIVFGREGTINTTDSNNDVTPDINIIRPDSLGVWEGYYYGTFFVYEGNDPYSEVVGTFEDVYCVIATWEDNSGIVLLWTMSYELGTVEILINPAGGGAMGSAVSISGELFGEAISRNDWTIRPSDCKYDNMIEIREIFVDSDGDWFDYEFYLRPWGMDWNDVEEYDLPQYYDWYLAVCDFDMLEVILSEGEYMHSALT